MLKLPVYMDYNATTPCDGRVFEAMMPYFTEYFGNAASRSHSFGWQAGEAVNIAREKVSDIIGCDVSEIVFTSGATEACNLAIKGVFGTYASKGNHFITVSTEHKAVLDTCGRLEKEGAEVTYLKVKGDGLIDLGELESAIRPETLMIAVMYANNETGVLQPIREVGTLAKKHGILFFSDSTQAVGKVKVNVNDDNIDLLALSSHKMYGPKGVGALYIRRRNPRVKLLPQIDGGGHERGVRSGTLNVPGIVGLGKACELCMNEMENESKRTGALRDRLEKALLGLGDTRVNGSTDRRLPHVSNLSFRFGEGLISGFNKTIAVSSGSACSSASPEPSYVLKAIGLEDDLALGSIRFSLGRYTTEEEVDYTVKEVSDTVNKLRETLIL